MIIKSLRVRSTSGVGRLIRHLQNGDDNDNVAYLRGTPADLRDMQQDASARGSTYSVRHWVVAPHEVMSRPQMRQVLEMLATEFGFNEGRAVVVEHCKKRATADAADVHWHVLVGEIDPATGHVLKTSFDRVIHELIARVTEHRFGHTFVQGKHTRAVIKGLRSRKLDCIADSLEEAVGTPFVIPHEAFTHAQHQEKNRLGIDLPARRQEIKGIVSHATTRDELCDLVSKAGMTLREGEKQGTWILVDSANGVLIGALHRLAGVHKSEISAVMKSSPDIVGPQEPTKIASPKPTIPAPHAAQKARPQLKLEIEMTADALLLEFRAMESSASEILKSPVPTFSPSPAMRSTTREIREKEADLTANRNIRWSLADALWNAPSPRWWCYPLGMAKGRQRKIADLQQRIHAADIKVSKAQLELSARQSRLLRETKVANQLFVEDVRRTNRDHHLANERLNHARIAHSIIRASPEVASKGKDHVLALALSRMADDGIGRTENIEISNLHL